MSIIPINSIKSVNMIRKCTNVYKPTVNAQKNRLVENLLPIVSVPIIAYTLKGPRDANNANNLHDAIKKVEELFKKGKISKEEYNKRVKSLEEYYNKANNLPKEVSSAEIKKNEPNFKGNNENNLSDEVDTNNFVLEDSSFDVSGLDNGSLDMVPGLREDLDELKSVGIEMSPDLQEIYYAPSIDSVQELIEQILGDLSEIADTDFGAGSIICDMWEELIDMDEWF